jgi:hypothetical protein
VGHFVVLREPDLGRHVAGKGLAQLIIQIANSRDVNDVVHNQPPMVSNGQGTGLDLPNPVRAINAPRAGARRGECDGTRQFPRAGSRAIAA